MIQANIMDDLPYRRPQKPATGWTTHPFPPANWQGADVSAVPGPTMRPWVPMTDPLDVKHLGKLAEETNELGSATARCLIQGIDEREPVTGKLNREWLEDEIADVLANAGLVQHHFHLNAQRIESRMFAKMAGLRTWHAMTGATK